MGSTDLTAMMLVWEMARRRRRVEGIRGIDQVPGLTERGDEVTSNISLCFESVLVPLITYTNTNTVW